jgi:hypothetical protein
LVYAVRSDGVLLTCTILEQDDVAGWARHPIGGNGKVLSVVTESKSTGFDRVGLVVERTIDGVTRRYMEYLSSDPQIPDFSDYYTTEDSKKTDTSVFEKLLFELQKQFIRLDSALVLDTTQSVALTLGAVSGNGVTVTAASPLFSASDVGKNDFCKVSYWEGVRDCGNCGVYFFDGCYGKYFRGFFRRCFGGGCVVPGRR